MILKENKRFACGFNLIRAVTLFCLCIPFANYGQDTISLRDVEINANKEDLSKIGKKTETIDSTLKEQFKFNSAAEAISLNSPVFIKSYGPGGLATTAFRGGNASQTAVLWNGFNLQNAMLGQVDLALMPAFLFESIEIEYGGSAALWGSGAVAGSIHLNNKSLFGKGLFSSTNLGGSGLGARIASTGLLVSKQRFISSTKIYLNDSKNDYKYKDTLDKNNPLKRQQHAGYSFIGLMQELKFLINSKQILSVNAWINSNKRELPSFSYLTESKSYQDDEALRLTANWSFINKNFRSNLRAGLFKDNINYTDSLVLLFSKSKSQTIVAENENYFKWRKNQQLNFGLNVSSGSAVTDNYESKKTISRISFLAGNKFSFREERLLAYVGARVEYFSVGVLPVTGNVSLEYKLSKHISAVFNTARVYRQPTLNELYWIPGGNKDLKAEQGYTGEGNLSFKKQFKNLSVFVSGAAFSRKVDNWILWLPGANGNPSPLNIQQVWSRGTETSSRIDYKKNNFRIGAGFISGYVLSTIQSEGQENSNTKNRQLIYTPRYTFNANFMVAYDKTNLIFFHQYIGYRYTTSDNSVWLNPYSVFSIKFSNQLEIPQMKIILFIACKNLFNNNYAILPARPMPLRYFEFGITIQSKRGDKER